LAEHFLLPEVWLYKPPMTDLAVGAPQQPDQAMPASDI
jgi:hypothetical protein